MADLHPMPNLRRPEIRSARLVTLAYAVGAAAGACVGAITDFLRGLSAAGGAGENIGFQAIGSLDTAMLLFFVCLVFELIVATPILHVLRVKNWCPPSPFAASAFGFALSGLLAAAVSAVPLGDGTSGPLGYFSGSALTQSGWWRLVLNVAQFGAVGSATAIAFVVTAIRRRA